MNVLIGAGLVAVGALIGAMAVKATDNNSGHSEEKKEQQHALPPTSVGESSPHGMESDENIILAIAQVTEGDAVMSQLLCPITQELMRDPVMTKYGHLFERVALEAWLAKSGGKCPLTQNQIGPGDYHPAYAVKQMIEEYSKK